jgi:hypothetical protein
MSGRRTPRQPEPAMRAAVCPAQAGAGRRPVAASPVTFAVVRAVSCHAIAGRVPSGSVQQPMVQQVGVAGA